MESCYPALLGLVMTSYLYIFVMDLCCCHNQNVSKSDFLIFITHKNFEIHNFSTIGPKAMKQSLCTPSRRGLSDGIKHVIGGCIVREIST